MCLRYIIYNIGAYDINSIALHMGTLLRTRINLILDDVFFFFLPFWIPNEAKKLLILQRYNSDRMCSVVHFEFRRKHLLKFLWAPVFRWRKLRNVISTFTYRILERTIFVRIFYLY